MLLPSGKPWDVPDSGTILNRTVASAAAIMANRAACTRLLASIMRDKATEEGIASADKLVAEAEAIEAAVLLMLERDGCWA